MGIFDKCTNYKDPDKVIEAGVYPYFRMIESQQDPVVNIFSASRQSPLNT